MLTIVIIINIHINDNSNNSSNNDSINGHGLLRIARRRGDRLESRSRKVLPHCPAKGGSDQGEYSSIVIGYRCYIYILYHIIL